MPPQRDHRIPLAAAAALTRRHREAAGGRTAAEGEHGGMFPRDAVQRLLARKGCEGLRIYYGRAEAGTPVLVLVGVDADGNDIAGGEILEWSFPCPPYCGDPDGLNS